MTIASLYDTARGVRPGTGIARSYNDGPQPSFYSMGEDRWRHDPRSNPMLSPANSDYEAMAYNEEVQKLADELLKKNQANQAKQRVALLRSLVQRPEVNLFGAPTSPEEEAAQSIVQEHINAGNRGVADWQRRLVENKKDAEKAFARNLQLRAARLNEAKFQDDLAKERQMFPLQLQGARSQIADRATDNARLQENLARQKQQFADAQKQRRFQEALNLIQRGDVDPAQLVDAYPDLSPQHFAALNAASEAIGRDDYRTFNAIKSAADNYSNQLSDAMLNAETGYEDSAKGWFGSDNATPEGREAARERARRSFLQQNQKDFQKFGTRYDEATGTIVPIQSAPRSRSFAPVVPARRPGVVPGGGYGAAPSFGPGNIPMVRTPSDLQRYSNYPVIMDPAGNKKNNPAYRPSTRSAVPDVVPANEDWATGYDYMPQDNYSGDYFPDLGMGAF